LVLTDRHNLLLRELYLDDPQDGSCWRSLHKTFNHSKRQAMRMMCIFLLLVTLYPQPIFAGTGHGTAPNSGIGLDDPFPTHFSNNSDLLMREDSTDTRLLADNPGLTNESRPAPKTEGQAEKRRDVEPISRALPIWGERARQRGADLPLPFGLGVHAMVMSQAVKLTDLQVQGSRADFDPGSVSFKHSRATDTVTGLRGDVWLFPFANVYGQVGYLDGRTKLNVEVGQGSIDIPGIGEVPISEPVGFRLDSHYYGILTGLGMTLTAGYQNVFASLDANGSHTQLDVTDSELTAYSVTPRIGWRVTSSTEDARGALWIGAMFLEYDQTITGSISTASLDPMLPGLVGDTVNYEIRVRPENRWNLLLGGQWEIQDRWQVIMEGGLGQRIQMMAGAAFRF
jgi:hypothetical protein